MKMRANRMISASLLTGCIATSVGCFYAPYPHSNYASGGYGQDSKGYSVAGEPLPPQEPLPPAQPHYVGVDPGLAIAGVAAAGLLGYALGDHHGYHDHHGYYGGYYGHGYYHPHY